MRDAVTKEDYEEPRCPLCMDSEVTPIPVSRVIEKLDFYFHKNDLPSAERHLAYWKSEAQAGQYNFLCADSREQSCAERKYELIEETASELINALREKELTKAVCGDLEKHACSVNDHIKDGVIRNLNILTAV